MIDYKEMQQDLELIFPIISGKVSMAINRVMSRNFRRDGLEITPEQWTVLAFLWREDGVTQQRLCDATFKDKPSMTRLIDNLEKAGLVERKASPNDRRANLVYLTETGHCIKKKAEEAVQQTVETALAGLDEEQVNQMRNTLRVVFLNMRKEVEGK